MSGSIQVDGAPTPGTLQLLLRPGLPLIPVTFVYVVANALDVLMTWILLTHDRVTFIESNPVARYFLYGWGLTGMLYFKILIVCVVILICQVIARSRMHVARRLLYFATATVSLVVLYSVGLLFVHT